MNETPNPNGSEDTQEEIAVLRHQLTSTLMLVLAVAVIVTWFFSYQFYFTLKDSRRAAVAAKETRVRIEEFNRVNEPQFQELVRKLQEYAKTHPDVKPILAKYGVLQATNAPSATPKK